MVIETLPTEGRVKRRMIRKDQAEYKIDFQLPEEVEFDYGRARPRQNVGHPNVRTAMTGMRQLAKRERKAGERWPLEKMPLDTYDNFNLKIIDMSFGE